VAAALPAPDYAVYGASKAALEGFARSLRIELAGRVGVQMIHPGATRTGMHAKIGAPLAQIGWRRFPPAARVAAQIVRAIDGGRPLETIGAANRLLRFAGRQLGGLVDRAIARKPAIVVPTPGKAGHRHHIIITGGADGIGWALAERYARQGCDITMVDVDATRAAARCAELRRHGAAARAIAADLSGAAAVAGALEALGQLPPADMLIHSAGISAVGRFADMGLAPQRAVLDVNLRAPLLLTAGLLGRGMLAPGGTLVFIASLSVFTGYPGAAAYAASKDGVAAYARSLRAAGLKVLTVYPGPTRTAHARRYSPDNRREGRRMPPERLAALIAAAVEARRSELVPGPGNRLIARVGRVAPALTEYLMRKTILEKLPHSRSGSSGRRTPIA
jgi:short-subunit dehydrogenase